MSSATDVRGATRDRRNGSIPSPNIVGFAILAIIGMLIFLLNHDPVTEQDIFVSQYQPYADYITGDGTRDVMSYPMWGYPAVIALIGDTLRMALQYILAMTVVLMLLRRLNRIKPLGMFELSIVAIMSVPWFAISSLNSATAIALPLIWIAILFSLDRAGGVLGIKNALVAGLLIGLALNFRSEFLVLPVLLSVWFLVLPAVRNRNLTHMRRTILPALVLSVVGGASLLPWAAFTHGKTGEANLTSTNGGAVSYITLGQLAGNPWGIIHEDAQAQRTLSDLGHTDVNPYSPEGNDILMSLFLDSIRAEPVAYARKVAYNARNIFLGGLYFGDWEHWIPGTDSVRIDVYKEKVKDQIGVNPHQAQIAAYRDSGVWDEGVGISEVVLLTTAALVIIGTNVLTLISAGVVIFTVLRRRLTAEQAVPLLMIAYVFALVSLLQYQPRHVNAALPAMIIISYPLLNGTIAWLRRRVL